GWRTGWCRSARRSPRRARSRTGSPPFRSNACWRTGRRPTRNGTCRWPRPCARKAGSARRSSLPRARPGRSASSPAKAGTAVSTPDASRPGAAAPEVDMTRKTDLDSIHRSRRLPTYRELIRRGARQHGPRVAVVVGGRPMGFAEADRLASRLAHALIAEGGGGTRVALLLDNGLHSVPVDFACVRANVNRVPLNSRLSLAEHRRMLEETGCHILLYGADLSQRAQELREAVPTLQCLGLGVDEDLLAMAAGMPADEPDTPANPEDVVMTLFTSGTTGSLKAARHTQASYAGICRNIMLNLMDIQRDDAMLH